MHGPPSSASGFGEPLPRARVELGGKEGEAQEIGSLVPQGLSQPGFGGRRAGKSRHSPPPPHPDPRWSTRNNSLRQVSLFGYLGVCAGASSSWPVLPDVALLKNQTFYRSLIPRGRLLPG